jgi:solute carrier family 35 protein E1
LFTVLAYALLFGVSYSLPTYISLFPLTFGVMLATSVDFSLSNVFGLFCAFGSTIVFVSQNIFFKKIMPTNAESSTSTKLDKINLLFYSSGTAFVLMVPLWLYSDAWRVVNHVLPPNAPSITLYFFLNGTVHFAQNLLAFAILSSTSPVTYSIASLVKRIAVICLAIVWFKQTVHYVQAVGICLTGVGLLMYNNAKRDVEKGEKRMRQVEALRDGMLPTSLEDQRTLDGGSDLKLAHSSPRPEYSHQFNPISKSSAIRKFDVPLNNIPYPSPPPSTTSSPPDQLMPLPPSAMHVNSGPPMNGSISRQRRMSVDATIHQQPAQHVGHAASNRQPPTLESAKGVMASQ